MEVLAVLVVAAICAWVLFILVTAAVVVFGPLFMLVNSLGAALESWNKKRERVEKLEKEHRRRYGGK